MIVLGYPHYYPRFGFEPASRRAIRSEWEVPDEAFMILVLDEARMQDISGVARYRPEFSAAMQGGKSPDRFYGQLARWEHQTVEMGGYADFCMLAHGGSTPVARICHA